MIISRTHKAAWQCGESGPACLVARNTCLGRRDGSTAAPWLPCPPEAPSPGSLSPSVSLKRWGHPADLQRVSAGVSEGMGGTCQGKGRRNCQFSLFPDSCQKSLLYSSHLGTPCSPGLLWVWGSSLKKLDKKGITMQAPAAVQNNWALSQKVKRTATVCPSYSLLHTYPKTRRQVSVHRIHNSTIHNKQKHGNKPNVHQWMNR